MAQAISKVRSARDKYDWGKWKVGKAWRVVRGVEFDCQPEAFRTSLYSRARRFGLKVTASIHGDAVEFEFTKRAKSRRK